MRPIEITDEAVIKAGNQCLAEGRINVTGFALRHKLGGGNTTRLQQVWNKHMALPAEAATCEALPLPSEVQAVVESISKSISERVSSLAVELYTNSTNAAQRKFDEAAAIANKQSEQTDCALSEVSETVVDLEQKLDASQEQIACLESCILLTNECVQAKAIEVAQLRERLVASDQTAESLKQTIVGMNSALEMLRAEAKRTDGELFNVKAKADAAVNAHDEKRKLSAAEVLRCNERLMRTEAELSEARKLAATAREDAAKLAGTVEALQGQIANAKFGK